MNKKTEELSIFQFQQRFPDDKAYLLYLAQKSGHKAFHVIDVNTINTVEEVKNMPDSVLNAGIKLHQHQERYFTNSNFLS